MKKLTKIAAILTMVSTLMGCNKEPVNNGPEPDQPGVEVEYTDDIEFAIEILSVEATAAEVKVEHTGTKDDTWYGFVTTSTNIRVAIQDMVEELTRTTSNGEKSVA